MLISGGLDSILAALVLERAGVRVKGVCFSTPFFGSARALRQASRNGIDCVDIDITHEHLAVLRKPHYGYGKNMNPCIDCHILMVAKAVSLLPSMGAHFVATGEVLGERPMSQNRNALDLVALRSGAGKLLLRPLSARLLDLTLPETEGWIKRDDLLAISGRSRKPQMELAAELGVVEYENPAGGCLLTDPGFSARLRELMDATPAFEPNDIELLKTGRHFRSGRVKVVIGRDEPENERLSELARGDDRLFRESARPGPTALLRPYGDVIDGDVLAETARLLGEYGKGKQPLAPAEIEQVARMLAAPSVA
ncbi:MAG: tRNA 4-thiouridine(8) synthase ThiI [Candidatus Geothermincolia bacterium]